MFWDAAEAMSQGGSEDTNPSPGCWHPGLCLHFSGWAPGSEGSSASLLWQNLLEKLLGQVLLTQTFRTIS